jgi:biopolymer transport protein TolR
MKYKRYKRKSMAGGSVNINVTPLVDVMLVLIIIFMIAAPMLTVGVQVDLPKTRAATMNDQIVPVIVSINKSAEVFIEDVPMPLSDLQSKISAILKAGKTDVIYVRGDKSLPYGRIMEIMGLISSVGGCKVSLISEADNSKELVPVQPAAIKPTAAKSVSTKPVVVPKSSSSLAKERKER